VQAENFSHPPVELIGLYPVSEIDQLRDDLGAGLSIRGGLFTPDDLLVGKRLKGYTEFEDGFHYTEAHVTIPNFISRALARARGKDPHANVAFLINERPNRSEENA